jgi:hypothetical protein
MSIRFGLKTRCDSRAAGGSGGGHFHGPGGP